MTTKQRAYLRSMGAMYKPVLYIGKEGLIPTLLKQCYDALEARELIKVQVQKGAPYTAKEACEMLCESVHAEPVQVIGNRFLIYREANKDPQIHLSEIV